MRISDWSSDVCSSDLEQDFLVDDADRRLGIARVAIDVETPDRGGAAGLVDEPGEDVDQRRLARAVGAEQPEDAAARHLERDVVERLLAAFVDFAKLVDGRSEEHTSELQSIMRISYA